MTRNYRTVKPLELLVPTMAQLYYGYSQFDFYLPFSLFGRGTPYVVRELLFHHGKREGQLNDQYRTSTKRVIKACWRSLFFLHDTHDCGSSFSRRSSSGSNRGACERVTSRKSLRELSGRRTSVSALFYSAWVDFLISQAVLCGMSMEV
jgi:hypothetical protein